MSHIDTLLERADVIYKQVAAYRTPISVLLAKVSESNDTKEPSEGHTNSSSSGSNGGNRVSKTIQLLSQKYASDCKSSFDDLSKIIQEILISRKELTDYNAKQSPDNLNTNNQILSDGEGSMKNVSNIHSIGKCYGCTVAAVENCVTVMKAFATNEIMKTFLCKEDVIAQLMRNNLHSGTTRIHDTTRELLCLLAKDNRVISNQISYMLERRVQQSIFSHFTKDNLAALLHQEMRLLIDMVDLADSCWEDRLKTVIRLCLIASKTNSPVTIENVVVPCLRILSKLIQPPLAGGSNKVCFFIHVFMIFCQLFSNLICNYYLYCIFDRVSLDMPWYLYQRMALRFMSISKIGLLVTVLGSMKTGRKWHLPNYRYL